jgi:hypothetical protein
MTALVIGTMLAVMTTKSSPALNTVKLIEDFWLVRWPSYSPGRRSIVRGRLVVMAATLLDDPVVAQDLVHHLRMLNSTPNVSRPEPTSQVAWAASYLIHEFLPRPWAFTTTVREPMSTEHAQGSRWLNHQSMPASAITDIDLVRLRKNMGGTAYNTLNRPGFPGDSKPWKGWSHGRTETIIEAVSA